MLEGTKAASAADRDSFARAIHDSLQSLAEDQSFKDLAQSLTFLRYKRYSTNKMEVIDDCVRQCMSEHDTEWLRLHTEWDPDVFMSSLTKEYGKGNCDSLGLGCLLTLTGSDIFPHADTCMAYVKRTWPQLGHIIIRMLESALLEAMGVPATAQGQDNIARREDVLKLEENGDYFSLNLSCLHTNTQQGQYANTPIMVSFGSSPITLELNGSVDQLIEVTQVVAWISSALRLLPQDQPPTSCLTTLTQDSEGLAFLSNFHYTRTGFATWWVLGSVVAPRCHRRRIPHSRQTVRTWVGDPTSYVVCANWRLRCR